MTPSHIFSRLLTAPNVLTLLRPVCTGPFVLLCGRAYTMPDSLAGWGALGVFLVIVATDLLDGWLARRRRQESALGRTLDHGCDVLFILTALGSFVHRGLVPWWLPSAIAWSFALYVFDSWWRTATQPQPRLLTSRLGHIGGMLYYVVVGMVTCNLAIGNALVAEQVLSGCFTALALLALVSGTERLGHLVRTWRHPSRVVPAVRTPNPTRRSTP